MQSWHMQYAKAHMFELIKCAQIQPQDITVHGKSVAVVVSRATFDRLTQSQDSLFDFMCCSSLFGDDSLELARDQSLVREVSL